MARSNLTRARSLSTVGRTVSAPQRRTAPMAEFNSRSFCEIRACGESRMPDKRQKAAQALPVLCERPASSSQSGEITHPKTMTVFPAARGTFTPPTSSSIRTRQ
eukprot:15466936-Alexandrium_andersonii.AAC.1